MALDSMSVYRYTAFVRRLDMNINALIEQKNMTKYKLAKLSGVPHTTVIDICSGKTSIGKCNAETLYKLAKALDVSMDTLVAESIEKRQSFENFKSTVCHMVKGMGEVNFLIHILESNDIHRYYDKQWYLESLYLLAMVDYLSRENGFPLAVEYNELRRARLEETVYPAGVLMLSALDGSDHYKQLSVSEAIAEFMRHNIVESEIHNVC